MPPPFCPVPGQTIGIPFKTTKEHYALGAVFLKDVYGPDKIVPFEDRAYGIICGQDTLSRRDHFDRDAVKRLDAHSLLTVRRRAYLEVY